MTSALPQIAPWKSYTCKNVLDFKDVGVERPNCSMRRTAQVLRNTPLVHVEDYDFRSPNPLGKNGLPYYDPGDLSSSIRHSRVLDKSQLKDTLDTQTKKVVPRMYFGPTATGAEYKTQHIYENVRELSCISPGTRRTKTFKEREKKEVRYEHTGVWEKGPDGESFHWSCCGSEDKGSRGCVRHVRAVGRDYGAVVRE